MTKDLTTSNISRQNILNNSFALNQIEFKSYFRWNYWQDKAIFTKAQVSQILEIDQRTVDRYKRVDNDELSENGYEVLKRSKT